MGSATNSQQLIIDASLAPPPHRYLAAGTVHPTLPRVVFTLPRSRQQLPVRLGPAPRPCRGSPCRSIRPAGRRRPWHQRRPLAAAFGVVLAATASSSQGANFTAGGLYHFVRFG